MMLQFWCAERAEETDTKLPPLAVLALASLAALVTLGCGQGDVPGTVGELGEGVFRYSCFDASDARCNEAGAVSSLEVTKTLGVDPELPTAIAVGGRFDLTYLGDTIDDGDLLIVDVEPARTDLVSHAAGFVIEAPGTFAFLARNGPKKTVADFMHLDAFLVTGLDIWHSQETKSSIVLNANETSTLAVVPMADGGVALAGALSIEWTSSDMNIVAIGSASSALEIPSGDKQLNEDEIRIAAIAEGQATITVSQGDVTQELTVTVAPEVMP